MALGNLNVDCTLLVLEYLATNRTALSRLLRTNKTMFAYCVPILYRDPFNVALGKDLSSSDPFGVHLTSTNFNNDNRRNQTQQDLPLERLSSMKLEHLLLSSAGFPDIPILYSWQRQLQVPTYTNYYSHCQFMPSFPYLCVLDDELGDPDYLWFVAPLVEFIDTRDMAFTKQDLFDHLEDFKKLRCIFVSNLLHSDDNAAASQGMVEEDLDFLLAMIEVHKALFPSVLQDVSGTDEPRVLHEISKVLGNQGPVKMQFEMMSIKDNSWVLDNEQLADTVRCLHIRNQSDHHALKNEGTFLSRCRSLEKVGLNNFGRDDDVLGWAQREQRDRARMIPGSPAPATWKQLELSLTYNSESNESTEEARLLRDAVEGFSHSLESLSYSGPMSEAAVKQQITVNWQLPHLKALTVYSLGYLTNFAFSGFPNLCILRLYGGARKRIADLEGIALWKAPVQLEELDISGPAAACFDYESIQFMERLNSLEVHLQSCMWDTTRPVITIEGDDTTDVVSTVATESQFEGERDSGLSATLLVQSALSQSQPQRRPFQQWYLPKLKRIVLSDQAAKQLHLCFLSVCPNIEIYKLDLYASLTPIVLCLPPLNLEALGRGNLRRSQRQQQKQSSESGRRFTLPVFPYLTELTFGGPIVVDSQSLDLMLGNPRRKATNGCSISSKVVDSDVDLNGDKDDDEDEDEGNNEQDMDDWMLFPNLRYFSLDRLAVGGHSSRSEAEKQNDDEQRRRCCLSFEKAIRKGRPFHLRVRESFGTVPDGLVYFTSRHGNIRGRFCYEYGGQLYRKK